ncbi:LysR family transcriptional regulator [Pseudomonas stutzeri]|jgi:DNA-binding transcriptional LysR family regulator|uniref:LysR family transcriptional regulator n=1 Tax=Stutzerimonas stutzeri TaxID=316 RepID=UPI0003576445|nr:LysR family transcriptional regulator [Stutzerimonas stutzeri]EPL62546.1 LysR family transcriptional regulator [Stutzerimonas stutzeri B1SMN1]AVX14015.1 LysR family transcriptional regulator [Stutzerimonas stutzeri]MCQ4229497.1 LysR family transcriptional regulator [Stutzerimonas stutzeri]MDH0154896.1 LysR family transcriptional regulator [Stutzerimonas stutzeri]MDH0211399.1 LysR family transcriptional regulator [Stutzerimonas stutzeri]
MARDLPPLNALRAFEAAARLGSLSEAARELHVTHGAISRQVKQLEEQLGVGLFVKEGRGVKLTDAGARMRDAASEAFERLRSTCAELQRQTAEAPFVLGCPGSLLARWFIPRLDRLNRDLPELRLQLSASEGELDPRKPGLDATLWYAEPPWPADMQVFELAAERIGPVLSPYHPRCADLRGAPPSAVLDETLLHTASRPQAWPNWARQQGLDPARLRLGQSFEHLYFLLEAALAGLGVAIAPQQLVADDLRQRRLLAPWGFVETRARLALWVPARRVDRRAERLAEWLRNELERQ